ncbi:MAG: carboxypeptidase regulatory-like domain-containing protein [Nitrospirae bacterium]|nr:carboxypeptidase regulatory-like domain-containing protein [Nitrospirota bacterium]
MRGTVNESQGSVLVNGVEAVISNRNFTAEPIPLVPGPNTITASGSDQWGNTASAVITVNLNTTPRQTLTIESGNNQSSLIGTMLPAPLLVSLRDENDAPVSGEPVIFRVAENNGVLLTSGSGLGVRAVAVTTDAEGYAQADFRVGTWAGSGNNRVDVTATGVDGNVIFIASGTQKPPAAIYVAQGNQQRGGVNQPLPEPLVVFVTDEGHNPLDNIPVIFKAVEGGGLFLNGLDNITVNTDSDGRAAVSYILGPNAGNDGNVLEATFEGNTMPPAGFTATGLIPGDPGDTRISGVVLDNSNNPITNVTIRIEGTTREAVSDSNGQFTVNNVPVGPVHLIADGTTAGTPGVLEYPTLMYEITTVAGANNSVGVPVYLVPLDLVNSKVVGGSADVIYTIPEVPGFELTVKANSVTFPNGDRQGSISVTQVHADKVPMVPQIGQQPRFIVTIQPPGTVFDPPAPLKIPNVDGLAPGEKTNMYSFDHDLGIFVSIGTGTVSEDGTLIVSDPGVGVVKAGWHCGGNPAPTGSANNCPECQRCDNNRCVTDAAKNNTCCGGGTKICQNGSCNPVLLNSATAKANGQDEVTIAKNETVNFTGIVSGSNCEYEYNWDFGDGGTSTAQSPSHLFDTIGEYTVTFRVRCRRCGPPEKMDTVKVLVGIDIAITSTVPADELILNENAVINYEIKPPGQSFDTVVMEIRNSSGTLVVKKEGLPASAGTHSTSWENAKWNQAPFAGKYANPKNGPYQIKLTGTKNGDTDYDSSFLNTKLIIEADIKDEKAAGSAAARSAGLGDLIDALKIVMKLGGNETVVSGAGSITITGATPDQKHIKVDAPALNNLDSGIYDVLFRDLRDEVGNFADEDGSAGNGIQPLKFPLEMR